MYWCKNKDDEGDLQCVCNVFVMCLYVAVPNMVSVVKETSLVKNTRNNESHWWMRIASKHVWLVMHLHVSCA